MDNKQPVEEESIYRPESLDEFVGQKTLIEQLKLEVRASIVEGRAMGSMVLSGPPGLGKSSLTELLAKARGVAMLHMQGSRITQRDFDVAFWVDPDPSIPATKRVDRRGYARQFDPVSGKTRWLPTGELTYPTILRLDEWELAPRKINQNLHDVANITDTGRRYYQTVYRGRSVDAWVPEVTLVIITNDLGKLLASDEALVNRCPIQHRFEPYTHEQLVQILSGFARKRGVEVELAALDALAVKSRQTPRKALQLFRQAQNILFAEQFDTGQVNRNLTLDTVKRSFEISQIDSLGLGEFEQKYLLTLYQAENRTLPLETLVSMLDEDARAITTVYEPDLMRMGLVMRYQGKGRQLTEKGVQHIQRTLYHQGEDDMSTDVIVDERY